MVGLNLNFGGAVLKREARPIGDVEQVFTRNGWTVTGQAAGGRIRYVEEAGVNLTLIQGPLGTVIIPSGPIRGSVFSDTFEVFSRTSVIGAGAVTRKSDSETKDRRPENRTNIDEIL